MTADEPPSDSLPPGYCTCGDPIDGDDPELCETCRMIYGDTDAR